MKRKLLFGFIAALVLTLPVATAQMYGQSQPMERQVQTYNQNYERPMHRDRMMQEDMRRDQVHRQRQVNPHAEVFNRYDYRNIGPVFQHKYERQQRDVRRAHTNYMNQLRHLHEKIHRRMHHFGYY